MLGAGPDRPAALWRVAADHWMVGVLQEYDVGRVRPFAAGLAGRLFSTFIDGGSNTIACTPGVCLVGLHVSVGWQAEFTAGVIVRLP